MISTTTGRTFGWLRCMLLGGLVIGGSAWADTQALLEDCAGCHGKDGASAGPDMPIIGGYSATYLTESLKNYKNKARPCPDVKHLEGSQKGQTTNMCNVASKLSEADMTAIGDHLSKKPFVRARQSADAAKAERGRNIHEAHCTKCHEDGGSSPDDDAGILAGQWMPYVRHTFEEFKSGQRPMPKKMKPKFDELSADDVDALVNYFGNFK